MGGSVIKTRNITYDRFVSSSEKQKGKYVQSFYGRLLDQSENCSLEDKDNLYIDIQKCHFAKTQVNWLGYKFTQIGMSPLEKKTAAILAIPPPITLLGFLGCYL